MTKPTNRVRINLTLDPAILRDFKVWAAMAKPPVHHQDYIRDILDQAHKHVKGGGK